MKSLRIAGLASLAALGAHAQAGPIASTPLQLESLVVTATRSLQPEPSLRDTVVITRQELEDAGPISLGELLERRAGVELRATGGPGQPESVFIRGAGPAQTLVLIDGLRASSSTAGTTAIEAIPLEMIERIEVVKGPLSSLYGSEAAGGVIQVFTRGKDVPNLFASAGYGSNRDRRAAAGLATSDGSTLLSLSAGARRIDAPSATNERSPSFFPDRDPHENAWAALHASHRLWTGETLALEAFGSRSRTFFDAGAAPDGSNPNDRAEQTLAGVRFSSSTKFTEWWASRLSVGEGRDRLEYTGQFASVFETRTDQATWINELPFEGGALLLGLETVRESVRPDRSLDPATGEETVLFTRDHRDTNSGFAALSRTFQGQRVEASVRHDREDQFGNRNTGSVSYGFDWPQLARISATWARGFRAPTFNDLYGPSYPGFYTPNPLLQPERSASREASVASLAASRVQWKVTAFDNRLDDLIVFSPSAQTVLNVARARIRGLEASIDASWLGLQWHGNVTAQRPRDEETGRRLQSRAGRFGTLEASRAFGAWNAGLSVFASGERFDSTDEAPGSRLPGYAILDAHVRYAIDKHWTAELSAANLLDKRYEGAVGYDAPGRSVFLNVRFDAY
ncbi:MAG TPA: TonB-dependent receptor [Usitatibacter sp.]|nr:TonB-dependent receptor [Usitatibacter sp.]